MNGAGTMAMQHIAPPRITRYQHPGKQAVRRCWTGADQSGITADTAKQSCACSDAAWITCGNWKKLYFSTNQGGAVFGYWRGSIFE
jgi:hypothetical protein